MLAENTEEYNNCLDNDYEQSENILNEIQSFQNIGGNTSIFTGKLSQNILHIIKNIVLSIRK